MNKEEAIPAPLVISRIGQQVYFQVKLPRDTGQVIGLEYATIGASGVPIVIRAPLAPVANPYFTVQSNKPIGRLTLWAPCAANIFLQADLQEDRNAPLGEQVTALGWQPMLWTHGRKQEQIDLLIAGPVSYLEGFYQDSWGVGRYVSYSYRLNLFIWINKCSHDH